MKTSLAWLSILLACGARAAEITPEKVEKITAYMAEYPTKVLAYGPNGLLQVIAEHGVTVNKDFEVIAVEATKAVPDVVWVFRDRGIPARCELVEHVPERRKAELDTLAVTLRAMDAEIRTSLSDIAAGFVAHLTCTAEKKFFSRPRFTSMMGDEKHLVMFQSPGYQGEAMFIAHFDATRMDVLIFGLTAQQAKPSTP
ncbi:MAG TPA: hypothetical protein VFV88_03230 [Steroidobacteraceae bacterium]|jgi:hypothetical protein|nr:hypothetical protein [Steroidobacteraceae bacterium]